MRYFGSCEQPRFYCGDCVDSSEASKYQREGGKGVIGLGCLLWGVGVCRH